jgi:hypothetical protein
MISGDELDVVGLYLEGFLFGKLSVLCALPCTLAKEVQSFLGLGIYSAFFALYLQCPLKESRTATTVFYVLCLLYVLSMATVVSDLLEIIINVSSDNSICKIIIILMRIGALSHQFQTHSPSMINRIVIVQTVVSGSCDVIAQCILVRINHRAYHPFHSPKSSKIFRCWIVWGNDIRVVVIPSFLAITYIGQYIYLHSLS